MFGAILSPIRTSSLLALYVPKRKAFRGGRSEALHLRHNGAAFPFRCGRALGVP
jgi:hypothetical protein